MIFSIRALQLRTLNTFWSVVWVMVSWRASEQWFWLGTSLENQILMYTRSWPVNIHSSQCISSKLDEVWEGVLVCFHCLAQIGVHEVYFIITVCHHIFHTDLSWKLGMGFGFMLNTGVWIHVEYGVVNSHHTFAEMGRSEHAASIHPSSHRRQRPGTWTWVESQEHVEQMIHLAVYNIFLVKSSHFLMSEVLKLSWISWVAISRVSGPERGNLRSIKTKLVRLPTLMNKSVMSGIFANSRIKGKRQYECDHILHRWYRLSSWSVKPLLCPVSWDSKHQSVVKRSWYMVEAVSNLVDGLLSQGYLKYMTQCIKCGGLLC